MSPEQLAARLAQAIPTQLKCVVLYGSAAAGDFVPGASNYNLLILVDPLGTAELNAMRGVISDWRKAGHGPPMLFTPTELAASSDAFPIEMLDIQQSRRVLWGEDVVARIEVHPEHTRLAVERELTGKLLALRGQFLLADGRDHTPTDLMLQSLSTILVLFRAVLRLYQKEVPATKLEALHALRKHIPLDTAPFEQLFETKQQSGLRATKRVPFDAYLQAIETVVKAVGEKK